MTEDSAKLAYNLVQAADATGVAVSKLRTLIRTNHIAAKYAGKDILILRTELERWLDSLPDQRR